MGSCPIVEPPWTVDLPRLGATYEREGILYGRRRHFWSLPNNAGSFPARGAFVVLPTAYLGRQAPTSAFLNATAFGPQNVVALREQRPALAF